MENSKNHYRSLELARLTGVSTDTLRYYERRGLIRSVPRSSNNYRKYPLETLERVRLIRVALCLGFTLRELADVLRLRDSGGVPCRQVLQMGREKLLQIEVRLRELTALRNDLARSVRSWSKELSVTPCGARAHLLEQLQRSGGSPVLRNSRTKIRRKP